MPLAQTLAAGLASIAPVGSTAAVPCTRLPAAPGVQARLAIDANSEKRGKKTVLRVCTGGRRIVLASGTLHGHPTASAPPAR